MQSILFPRVLEEPNTLLVTGVKVMSSAESRKYNKHSTQNHVSYGVIYLVPVRRSSSYLLVLLCTTNKTGGGRAMYVHSKYSSSITCSNRLYTYFSNCMMYINSGTAAAVYDQHGRWRASEGGRAIICMYSAIQQYLQ